MPLEMIFPLLAPRMKQLSQLISFGIEPGQIRSFVKIAINASQGKVVDVIATAVNLGNDVFDMERSQRRIILMQMTILASVLSALANLSLICEPIIYDWEFASCCACRLRIATNLFART